jgi:diguanylate cyclase (GGDEF)-like protein
VDSFENIIDKEIIKAQKNEIEKLNLEITEMSKIDFLTNLYNRRAFFEALEAEKKRTLRDNWRLSTLTGKDVEGLDKIKMDQSAKPNGKFLEHFGRFSCMLIDIDFFKKINDTYGHLIGDHVLKEMGRLLKTKEIFRENDIAGRFGGEEFIVILPETSAVNARIPAERLRESVKKVEFLDDKNKAFHVTISIGISEFSAEDKTNEDLINRADQALYYAKQRGRDQVIIYEEMV